MKELLKKLSIVLLLITATSLIAYLLLVLVYSIPNDNNVHLNMCKSTRIFENEPQNYPYMENCNSIVDDFHNAITLLIAGENNSSSPFYDALAINFTSYTNGNNPMDDIIYEYDQGYFSTNYPDKIKDFETVSDEDKTICYSRYWHGYLLYLKPLLHFFDLGGIRTILMFVTILLYSVLLVQTYRRKKSMTVPLFLFFIFFNPVSISLSLMYFPVTVITFSSMIFIVSKEKFIKKSPFNICIMFLLVGIITNYFDCLSFPIVSLFVPLIFILSLKDKTSLKANIEILFFSGLSWAIGYFSFMVIKLLMIKIFLPQDIYSYAISKAGDWLYSNGDNLSVIFPKLLFEGIQPLVLFCTTLVCVFTVYLIIKNKKIYYDIAIPLMLISACPFLNLLILYKHSMWHPKFTYRVFGILLFAILSYCAIYYDRYKTNYKAKKLTQKNL